MKKRKFGKGACALVAGCLAASVTLAAASADVIPSVAWDVTRLSAPQCWEVDDAAVSNDYGRIEGVRPVWIEGEDYCGRPTRIFAWWGLPKNASEGRKVPAMVLVHGGGGTAFASWVKTWNDRGYAAIAMDTCGGAPRGEHDGKPHPRHAWSGPFGWQDLRGYDCGGLKDEWPYQAVSAVIRCHSFLRNRPEVDAAHVGLTGISWGGYLTSIVMGVDGRFAFAAPVYGCGWYDQNDEWEKSFRNSKWNVETKGDASARLNYGRWLRDWDARNFIGGTRCPVLRCNGTRDLYYTAEMTERSTAALPQGTVCHLSIKNPMPHGHAPAGDPKEIAAWADHYLKGGPKPLEIVRAECRDGRLVVRFRENDDRAVAAELLYTTDSSVPNQDRVWQVCAATESDLADGEVGFPVPQQSKLFFANVRTAKGEVYSTRLLALSRPAVAEIVANASVVKTGNPVLRFGVLGDVHIDQRHFGEPGGGRSVEVFRMALRILGARAVDGVVIAGDLTQDGRIAELQRLADVWNEVFPGGKRFDGQPVERLFAFGDHDVEFPFWLLKYRPELLKDPKTVADLRANHIAYVDRAKVWKDVFHEAFSPIARKKVKGYDFVLAHLVNADKEGLRYADPLHIPGLEEFFVTNAFDRTKPFFYVQHKIPRGTVGGKYQSGQDSGRTTAILSHYPNAVGFNGHKHRTATEELSLWQGAFTQIQAPGLATLLTAAGRENSRCSCEAPCSTPPQQMDPLDTRFDGSHALIVSVFRDRLVIERIDVMHNGEPVAEPWTVRLPNDGSAAYEVRGKAAGVPQFSAGAKVSVAKRVGKDRAGAVTNQVVVSFPLAQSTKSTPRAYDYEVTAILSKGVVSRIVAQKRVYSSKCYWPERYDTNDVVCVFGRAEIPDNHESVKFVVRPMNAWGKAGEPIESVPDEYWSKGPLYPF